MTVPRNEAHSKHVQAWVIQNAGSLSVEPLLRLFEKAFHVLEQRSLATLSSVTVLVVIDRALHESQLKFPVLEKLIITPEGIKFSALVSSAAANDQLREALSALLIELLNVLGNITADILTPALHSELLTVTANSIAKPDEPQKLHSLRGTKTNRDQV